MAIICPFTKEKVLYLDCKECDDSEECRKLKYGGQDTDIQKQSADAQAGKATAENEYDN